MQRINQFMNANKIKIIIRSHECVMDGIEKFGNTNLYTVFSCTEYGGKYKNKASILLIKKNWTNIDSKAIDCLPGSTQWYKPQATAQVVTANDLKNRPITPPRAYVRG